MGSQDQNRSLRIRKQEGLRRLHLLGNPRSYSFCSDHILLCIIRWWRYSFTHSRRIRAIRGRIRKETNHKVNNKSEAYIFLYFKSRLNINHYKVKWITLIFSSLPGEVSELCFVHVRKVLGRKASILTKSRSSSPFGAMFVIWIRFFFHLQSIEYKILKFLMSNTLELFIGTLEVRTYIDLILTHSIKIFIINGLTLNSSTGNSTLFLIFHLEILTNANTGFIIWKLGKYFHLDFFLEHDVT